MEEANGTLPLVKRITADIVEGYRDLHTARDRYEEVKGQVSGVPTTEQGRELHRLEEEAEQRQEKIRSCLEELEMVGCQLKDFEMGLIDFPSERDGRPVLLCWKLGEESVSFWHSPESGYSGRQPLTD